MPRTISTLALAAFWMINALCPAGATGEEDLSKEELQALESEIKYAGRTVPWSADSPLFHPEEEWRPYIWVGYNPYFALHALPDYEADHVAELENPTQVEIVDGKSIFIDFGDPETKGGGLLYSTWIKVTAGGAEGWVQTYHYSDDGDETIRALVYFVDDYGPVREGPSDDAPIAQQEIAEVMYSENWLIGPDVPSGSLYFVACRLDNWYCVGASGLGSGWVRYDPALMDFYIPAYAWTARATGKGLTVSFYFPVEGEISKIIMVTHTWATWHSVEEDGLLTLRTKQGVFELRPHLRPGGLGHENYGEYYEIDLPKTLAPGDIEAADFSFTLEGEEVRFSFDPALSWEGRNGDE